MIWSFFFSFSFLSCFSFSFNVYYYFSFFIYFIICFGFGFILFLFLKFSFIFVHSWFHISFYLFCFVLINLSSVQPLFAIQVVGGEVRVVERNKFELCLEISRQQYEFLDYHIM